MWYFHYYFVANFCSGRIFFGANFYRSPDPWVNPEKNPQRCEKNSVEFRLQAPPELDPDFLALPALDSGLLALPGLDNGLLTPPGLNSGLLGPPGLDPGLSALAGLDSKILSPPGPGCGF